QSFAGHTRAPAGGARQRRDPPFEQLKLLAKFKIFLQQLLASRREMTVVLPPVETDLLCLVDRADHLTDANRQELDFGQRHLDVACDHQALVEHTIENVHQPGIAAVGTSCQVGRHADRMMGWPRRAMQAGCPARNSREPPKYIPAKYNAPRELSAYRTSGSAVMHDWSLIE